jgi:3'-phosphoadenosine 5'-phosphosulfate sulfotransferase (PAPS reductase)/FAD synthetase
MEPEVEPEVNEYLLRRQINERMEQHDKIALSFSGGKDSLACLFLVKTYWDRVTVYHVDTGDYLPEQREVIDTIAAQFPFRFVRIQTDVAQWMATNGLPSDLVPHSSHPFGVLTGANKTRLVSRHDCCYANMMAPLYARVVQDANTMLIRGTKAADMRLLPVKDGDVVAGIEFCYPVQDWTDEQVFTYLRLSGVTVSRVYDQLAHGLSCATCPAWWSERRGAYLKQHHPELFRRYDARLQLIIEEIAPVLAELRHEAGVG